MKTFEQFKAATMAEGFDEVLTREWEANHETPVHEHPFEAFGFIFKGEFWLTMDGKRPICTKVTPLELPDICHIRKNMDLMALPYGLLG